MSSAQNRPNTAARRGKGPWDQPTRPAPQLPDNAKSTTMPKPALTPTTSGLGSSGDSLGLKLRDIHPAHRLVNSERFRIADGLHPPDNSIDLPAKRREIIGREEDGLNNVEVVLIHGGITRGAMTLGNSVAESLLDIPV